MRALARGALAAALAASLPVPAHAAALDCRGTLYLTLDTGNMRYVPDVPRIPAAALSPPRTADHEPFSGLRAERARTGRVHGEARFRRKDGSRFLVDINSVVLQGPVECPQAFVILRDVTLRREQEDALRCSAERLETIDHQLPGAIQFLGKLTFAL